MRLERLEINGFKSFSDRSELAFDKGVTAIVGPNGCGKSNVADAITWVMGEQSAKSLRGDKMEDVIFSGSDGRKPTAAAEVRLRFWASSKPSPVPRSRPSTAATATRTAMDMATATVMARATEMATATAMGMATPTFWPATHHSTRGIPPGGDIEAIIQSVAREIEVTRRLYRSGESEYLIDGQICRLRDVHDLLMDTGLGAKAYAIIEQGKIGMILSTRPTDRRQLIEEAAGVTKYKARRRAAELKLEAAQLNLTRVDDIVFEVEKQRGTLKRQAGQGAALPEAARPAAPLGEGAVRAEVPPAGRHDFVRAGAAGRRAGARDARGGAGWRGRVEPRTAADRAGRGGVEVDRVARSGARARAGDYAPGAAARLRARAGRCARRADGDGRRRARGARCAPRAGARAARVAARRRGRRERRPRPRGGDAGLRIGRLRNGAPRDRRARSRRRSGAQRSVLGAQFRDRPAPRARARRGGARSRRRDAVEARRRDERRADRVGARGGGSRRCRRGAAARARRDRGLADRAVGARIGAGERAHRARVARPRRFARASTSWPASRRGCDRSKSSTRPAPATATRRGRSSSRPTARSTSTARSPTTSRFARATSARSRPASTISSSTSWSRSRSMRRRASSSFARRRRGAAASSSTSAAEAPVASGGFFARMSVTGDAGPVSDWGAAPGLAAASARVPEGFVALSSVVRVNGPFAGAIRHAIGDAWIAPDYDGAASASRLTAASSGDARGRCVPRSAPRVRRRARGIARHPGDEARDQGTARADWRRPRLAGAAGRRDRAARGHDRAGVTGDRGAQRRASQAGEGGRRLRGAAAARLR